MPLQMTQKQVNALTKRSGGRAVQLTLEGGREEAPYKRRNNHEEAQHQALLIAWKRSLEEKYPALEYLFATLNGIYLPPHLLAKAREGGLCKGVLDLWLIETHVEGETQWAGCILDLKRLKGGRPSADQLKWAAQLMKCGFRVYFPAGALDCWRVLCCYLGITGEDHWAADLQRQEELVRRISEALEK